jgi:putative FmdB family regulatory protein
MPLYEYQCDRCGRFEVIRKFSDKPLTKCPKCGGPIQRLPSAPAIQFKGTGWYVTDYAKKAGSEGSQSGEGSKGDEGSKGKEAGKDAKETSAPSSSSSGETSSGSTKSDTLRSETPKKAAASGSKQRS